MSLKQIKFIQYLRPSGRPVDKFILVDDETYRKAEEIEKFGFYFSCEVLTTSQVVFYISDPETEDDPAVTICKNGPEIPEVLKDFIVNFDIPAAIRQRIKES